MNAKNRPVSKSMRQQFAENYDLIFDSTPVGEDTRPKDRIKQGVSPSTEVEEWDCTKKDR